MGWWVGYGWGLGVSCWLEGDVGECESCHILVIDKRIKCLHIQTYKNLNFVECLY